MTALNNYIKKYELDKICTVLAGDFNLASDVKDDNVCQLLQQQGFVSTYYNVNNTRPQVTHLTHRGSEHLVDFIWMKSSDSKNINNNIIIPYKSYRII